MCMGVLNLASNMFFFVFLLPVDLKTTRKSSYLKNSAFLSYFLFYQNIIDFIIF